MGCFDALIPEAVLTAQEHVCVFVLDRNISYVTLKIIYLYDQTFIFTGSKYPRNVLFILKTKFLEQTRASLAGRS